MLLFGYWKIRGFGIPIQYLLEYVEAPYEIKRYDFAPGNTPEEIVANWVADKNNHGLRFPNIPFIIDNDVRLTESIAIMRYLGRKHNLQGSTEKQMQDMDEALSFIVDFRAATAKLFYFDWCPEARNKFAEKGRRLGLHHYLSLLDAFLKTRNYIAGEEITYVDFILYEVIEWCLFAYPNCLDEYDSLRQFHQLMDSLPSMEAFRRSDRYISWPLMRRWAKFGYKREDKYIRYPEMATFEV